MESTVCDLGRNMESAGLPGKPVAYNYGLLSVNYGLLWSIVTCYLGLLGVPGSSPYWNASAFWK